MDASPQRAKSDGADLRLYLVGRGLAGHRLDQADIARLRMLDALCADLRQVAIHECQFASMVRDDGVGFFPRAVGPAKILGRIDPGAHERPGSREGHAVVAANPAPPEAVRKRKKMMDIHLS